MSTSAKQMRSEHQPSRTLTPYLCYIDASAAIEFYKKAFGAVEIMRLTEESGKIGHAQLRIGDATFMMSDEYPDYGSFSARTIGGSPIRLHLNVPNVDQFTEQAVQAGATLVRPVQDQFYGDRAGQLKDPFGYSWIVATHIEDVDAETLRKRFEAISAGAKPQSPKKNFKREGFRTVTPYLTVEPAVELVQFVKDAFAATELFRSTGSAGGLHCELKIGDSMLIIGGGPGVEAKPAAIHLYVSDTDEVYSRAIAAGATSLLEPADQVYNERLAAVRDSGGNEWYIATRLEKTSIPNQHTVNVYFHPVGAPTFIEFLEKAFEATVLERHESSEGHIQHAKVRVGDSIVELGEAHGPWQPMRSALYMYVEDVDAVYERALSAGATSVLAPTDQPYGDRSAYVNDQFGNIWYLATWLNPQQ